MFWNRKKLAEDTPDLVEDENVVASVLAREGLRPDEIATLLRRQRTKTKRSPEDLLLAARSVV